MTDSAPHRDPAPDLPARPEGTGDAPRETAGVGAAPLEQDPIFQAVEPKERASRATVLVWQFFLFPLLVVAAAVGVFVFFGTIGGTQRGPKELLADLRSGGENQQKQASQQLAILIANERIRVDRERDSAPEGAAPRGAAPFYADPEFRRGLLDALRTALAEPDASEQRRMWLAVALGRIAPAAPSDEAQEIAAALLGILYPTERAPYPSAVRLHAALGLKDMESRVAEEALVRAATDPDDAQVRTAAVNGLALLGLAQHGGAAADSPRTRPVLLDRLDDSDLGVRLNAAVALALRGDRAGEPLVLRSLDEGELRRMGLEDAEALRNQKANAITAAAALGGDALRAAVERLAAPEHEQDAAIRTNAKRALERWSARTE